MRRPKRWIKLAFIIISLVILYKASIWQEESVSTHKGVRAKIHFDHGAKQQYSSLQNIVANRSLIFHDWDDESMVRYENQHKCKKQVHHRTDLGSLIRDMQGHEVWQWIQKRIQSAWPDWLVAARALKIKQTDQIYLRKNILVVPGVLRGTSYAQPSKIAAGGPLGELLQWADLIAGLYLLGHNITLESDCRVGAARLLDTIDDHKVVCGGEFDLIYVDVLAMNQMPPPVRNAFRCRFRVLDVYGTQAMHNDPEYSRAHALKSHGGGFSLHLKQFYTFYPQTPDNSFMGFVVTPKENSTHRENIAILYGKDPRYARGHSDFVSLLTKYMDVYYTMSEVLQFRTSGRLMSSGVLSSDGYGRLLGSSKLFVGLGEPIEGTGAMEALAHGCVFINPKFSGNAQKHFMDKKKPTQRMVTSQIPYLEQYVGPPHVRTVDIDSTFEVIDVVTDILNQQFLDPFIPEEFTRLGFLERLSLYVEHQNFCTRYSNSSWPPLSLLMVVLARDGQSCEDACSQIGRVCEPTFFKHINEKSSFSRFDLNCPVLVSGPEPVYPAIDSSYEKVCWLQENAMLFSCAVGILDYMRICPCRQFREQQIALWNM